MGMDTIIPGTGREKDTAADHVTSLEHAHALAVDNLKRAQEIRAQAVADQAPASRLEELGRLEKLAMEDVERTRRQL